MTEEEAKKKQLLAAYAWGRHSAAAPECFALDPDKLVALCALGVMPPKVEKGAGSTPATGSAGKGVSVGERPAVTCVATTTNTTGAGEKTAGAKHTPGPWMVLEGSCGLLIEQRVRLVDFDGGARPLHVAFIATSLNPSPRAEADARLIAAAPDLLAAWVKFLSAQRTIDSAGFMDNYTDAARARESQAQAIKAARAAIAKAEGQS